MFGTSTFYRLYTKNKKLHPLMLNSIKMAVAGAEKLDSKVKEEFFKKFGKIIYEGYGTTETSPVVSVNMPDMIEPESFRVIVGNKDGSVGQAIPGTVIKIVDPDTLKELNPQEDGLILVGGIQVMKGYLKDLSKTKEAIIKIDGVRYYKTGDKGHIDKDGFLVITDRFSRFAKIAGEMISLGAVQRDIQNLAQDIEVLAVSLKDEKKGEKIVILFSGDLEEDELKQLINSSKISPLARPSRIIKVKQIPKLASGKSDFKRAKEIANS
jgi:acyl-[acyl-carrier-protein]-phospholipid O-acyltransferase/long-chain-fatty-acid--[acyl-carrier-protein] ligase